MKFWIFCISFLITALFSSLLIAADDDSNEANGPYADDDADQDDGDSTEDVGGTSNGPGAGTLQGASDISPSFTGSSNSNPNPVVTFEHKPAMVLNPEDVFHDQSNNAGQRNTNTFSQSPHIPSSGELTDISNPLPIGSVPSNQNNINRGILHLNGMGSHPASHSTQTNNAPDTSAIGAAQTSGNSIDQANVGGTSVISSAEVLPLADNSAEIPSVNSISSETIRRIPQRPSRRRRPVSAVLRVPASGRRSTHPVHVARMRGLMRRMLQSQNSRRRVLAEINALRRANSGERVSSSTFRFPTSNSNSQRQRNSQPALGQLGRFTGNNFQAVLPDVSRNRLSKRDTFHVNIRSKRKRRDTSIITHHVHKRDVSAHHRQKRAAGKQKLLSRKRRQPVSYHPGGLIVDTSYQNLGYVMPGVPVPGMSGFPAHHKQMPGNNGFIVNGAGQAGIVVPQMNNAAYRQPVANNNNQYQPMRPPYQVAHSHSLGGPPVNSNPGGIPLQVHSQSMQIPVAQISNNLNPDFVQNIPSPHSHHQNINSQHSLSSINSLSYQPQSLQNYHKNYVQKKNTYGRKKSKPYASSGPKPDSYADHVNAKAYVVNNVGNAMMQPQIDAVAVGLHGTVTNVVPRHEMSNGAAIPLGTHSGPIHQKPSIHVHVAKATLHNVKMHRGLIIKEHIIQNPSDVPVRMIPYHPPPPPPPPLPPPPPPPPPPRPPVIVEAEPLPHEIPVVVDHVQVETPQIVPQNTGSILSKLPFINPSGGLAAGIGIDMGPSATIYDAQQEQPQTKSSYNNQQGETVISHVVSEPPVSPEIQNNLPFATDYNSVGGGVFSAPGQDSIGGVIVNMNSLSSSFNQPTQFDTSISGQEPVTYQQDIITIPEGNSINMQPQQQDTNQIYTVHGGFSSDGILDKLTSGSLSGGFQEYDLIHSETVDPKTVKKPKPKKTKHVKSVSNNHLMENKLEKQALATNNKLNLNVHDKSTTSDSRAYPTQGSVPPIIEPPTEIPLRRDSQNSIPPKDNYSPTNHFSGSLSLHNAMHHHVHSHEKAATYDQSKNGMYVSHTPTHSQSSSPSDPPIPINSLSPPLPVANKKEPQYFTNQLSINSHSHSHTTKSEGYQPIPVSTLETKPESRLSLSQMNVEKQVSHPEKIVTPQTSGVHQHLHGHSHYVEPSIKVSRVGKEAETLHKAMHHHPHNQETASVYDKSKKGMYVSHTPYHKESVSPSDPPLPQNPLSQPRSFADKNKVQYFTNQLSSHGHSHFSEPNTKEHHPNHNTMPERKSTGIGLSQYFEPQSVKKQSQVNGVSQSAPRLPNKIHAQPLPIAQDYVEPPAIRHPVHHSHSLSNQLNMNKQNSVIVPPVVTKPAKGPSQLINQNAIVSHAIKQQDPKPRKTIIRQTKGTSQPPNEPATGEFRPGIPIHDFSNIYSPVDHVQSNKIQQPIPNNFPMGGSLSSFASIAQVQEQIVPGIPESPQQVEPEVKNGGLFQKANAIVSHSDVPPTIRVHQTGDLSQAFNSFSNNEPAPLPINTVYANDVYVQEPRPEVSEIIPIFVPQQGRSNRHDFFTDSQFNSLSGGHLSAGLAFGEHAPIKRERKSQLNSAIKHANANSKSEKHMQGLSNYNSLDSKGRKEKYLVNGKQEIISHSPNMRENTQQSIEQPTTNHQLQPSLSHQQPQQEQSLSSVKPGKSLSTQQPSHHQQSISQIPSQNNQSPYFQQQTQPGQSLSSKHPHQQSIDQQKLSAQQSIHQHSLSQNQPQHQESLSSQQPQYQQSLSQSQPQHQHSLSSYEPQHQQSKSQNQPQHQESLSSQQPQHQRSLSQSQPQHQHSLSSYEPLHQQSISLNQPHHQESLSSQQPQHQQSLSQSQPQHQHSLSSYEPQHQQSISQYQSQQHNVNTQGSVVIGGLNKNEKIPFTKGSLNGPGGFIVGVLGEQPLNTVGTSNSAGGLGSTPNIEKPRSSLSSFSGIFSQISPSQNRAGGLSVGFQPMDNPGGVIISNSFSGSLSWNSEQMNPPPNFNTQATKPSLSETFDPQPIVTSKRIQESAHNKLDRPKLPDTAVTSLNLHTPTDSAKNSLSGPNSASQHIFNMNNQHHDSTKHTLSGKFSHALPVAQGHNTNYFAENSQGKSQDKIGSGSSLSLAVGTWRV